MTRGGDRALVTGATGFVGRALLAPLARRGFAVHAVSLRGARPAGPGLAAWHRADLLYEDQARRLIADLRPALLVHAAWYVAHGRFWTAPENGAWLEASTALAAHFAEAGGRRLVGIGTCAEYAEAAAGDGMPWPETRPVRPATPYGQAKAALAGRLAALAERHPRLSCAWARLFHLFGPGEHPDRLVPSIARALLAGREAACASGRPVRDFAATPFVGRAVAALAASGVEGPVNIASGRPTTIRTLVETLGRLTGRPWLLRLGRLPERPGEAPYVVADTRRLETAVGFREAAALERELRALLDAITAEELTAAGAA